jgi:hypothetical protein
MDLQTAFHFSGTEWVLVILAAFIIGLTKGGVKGVDMLSVTIMAIVFGSKALRVLYFHFYVLQILQP